VSAASPAPVEAGAATPQRSLFAGKLWFWLPWPPLVVLDLWSKQVSFAFLAEQMPAQPEAARSYTVFAYELLRFDLVAWRNPGTIWGLFQNGTVALMVLRCCAVLGMLWFVASTPRQNRLNLGILGLIFAGAIGNLYDNFTEVGRAVRDFARFSGQWPVVWDFPAFNVADSCITVGAFGLILLMLREDRASARAQKQVSS
jgi:signal peptidase II